jgi:hypothetical protein
MTRIVLVGVHCFISSLCQYITRCANSDFLMCTAVVSYLAMYPVIQQQPSSSIKPPHLIKPKAVSAPSSEICWGCACVSTQNRARSARSSHGLAKDRHRQLPPHYATPPLKPLSIPDWTTPVTIVTLGEKKLEGAVPKNERKNIPCRCY